MENLSKYFEQNTLDAIILKADTFAQGTTVAFVFFLVFLLFYYLFSKKEIFFRRMGIVAMLSIAVVIAVKVFISLKYTGYIADRVIFYALASPKANNIICFIATCTLFFLFLKYRDKVEKLRRQHFLLVLFTFFTLSSIGVASIRSGVDSLIDPFTRTHWEYSGNVLQIESTKGFLGSYIDLLPELAEHTITHPPGYTLFLYLPYKIFGYNYLSMSIFVIILGGLTIWPLYFLLKEYFSEETVRRTLQVFIFIPSMVLMSATSMEPVFMLLVWVTIYLATAGWNKSTVLSGLAGLSAALSLFSNFLFLLLAPVFLYFIYLYYQNKDVKKEELIKRVFTTVAVFILFYVFLYLWSGFSIIENFQSSLAGNQGAVQSNFESLKIYFTYFSINIVDFFVSIGIATTVLFFSKLKLFYSDRGSIINTGFVFLLFLLLIGVFQGELMRLWMFVIPFFLFPIARMVKSLSSRQLGLFLSLLWFQSVVLQILFYTYW